ncbi:hypothetical protein M0R45_033359 [Rubus argutus]|uniref:Nuclear pore complex protein Nup155 n=1 Tax=Rubus argutus TaxID=59490 RepID=A0AAW1WMZ8_RUBAR
MFEENKIVMRDVTNAGLVVSHQIGREMASQLDLEESLEASRYASFLYTYSTHPRELPPLAQVVGSWNLPHQLVEIKIQCSSWRAWASIDSSLFLWRFDGHCLQEYKGEATVCAVGLVKPKPSVFYESIEYVLVLATPDELILVGVSCSDGRDDPCAETSLHQLPKYTVPSDGVTMTCVACTDEGRIFMAGRDGHIYELNYSKLWRRCWKVCVSGGGLGGVISRWVVPAYVFKFGAVDPIVEMVFDNERHILYARTQAMKIQVYDADGGFKKVAEENNLIKINRTTTTKSSIVCIAPLSTMESKSLHLVAVLSDGSRIYFTTSPGNLGDFSKNHPRPSCLRVVTTRPSPAEKVYAGVYYSAGTLLLSDSSTRPSLVIVSRDSSTQSAVGPGILGTSTSSCSRELRESISSLPVEGEILSVADKLHQPNTATTLESLCYGGGDLSVQHVLPRKQVVVFSTNGVMEIVLNRPVDILRRLLASNSPRSVLQNFFNRYGAGEAAAMCLVLAARIVHPEVVISNVVAQNAAEAFEDQRLVRMGEDVEEGEPEFSASHDGLCLCSARLLLPLWELPVVVEKGGSIMCRLSFEAMQVLQHKIRSLENFLRSRRKQRRGIYSRVAGLGDLSGSILYRDDSEYNGSLSNKRQRLPYSPAKLTAMEVRAMECIRQLLLRSSEALVLLQLLSQHDLITRMAKDFDANLQKALVQMTFQQFVCSEEGDHLATRLASSLMEYYTDQAREQVEKVSTILREGCPSYYKESDRKFFLAMGCLDRAVFTSDAEEMEKLAREAFNSLSKVLESADLQAVCKWFERLRFYEAVVHLPLQKSQALDPEGDAFNNRIDAAIREDAVAQRVQCYEIIISALRSLKGAHSWREFGSSSRPVLDQVRNRYICEIVQLGIRFPDRLFHEYLCRAMIDLGLENELFECGGPDLVPLLQRVAGEPKLQATSSATLVPSKQAKYSEVLASYYALKGKHLLAARALQRLVERSSTDSEDVPTLDQRCQYLTKEILQAKNASNSDDLVQLLEGKLGVLRFQIKIKAELEALVSRVEALPGSSESEQSGTNPNIARGKAKELSLYLKSLTELLYDYAVPFELWEICLEMLYYASNSSTNAEYSDNIRESWTRVIDHALSRGGVAEACSVLKRLGSYIHHGGNGAGLPLDTLCPRLEKAALERLESGVESIGDEDVAMALIAAACKVETEPALLSTYDKLIFSTSAILQSPNLKLRLLRSSLVILRKWAMSVFAHQMSSKAYGASLILDAANRYMSEVRRLDLPQRQTEDVYRGFQEITETQVTVI